MGLAPGRVSNRLPQRFPVGAKYVVEGYGGGAGDLHVIARYVVLPGGRRINVPADVSRSTAPRALPFRPSSQPKRSAATSSPHGRGKKFAARHGTT